MRVTLSERDIESLSSFLASLLVAEWKARHSAHQVGFEPLGVVSMCGETDAKTTTYVPDPNENRSGPKPKAKPQAALRLVSGRKGVVHRSRHST